MGERRCAPPQPPPAPPGLPLSCLSSRRACTRCKAPGCGVSRTGVRIQGVELVRWSEDQVAVARSALTAARTVLRADYCAIAWQPADGGAPQVIATQGVSDVKARERSRDWLEAAVGGQPRASQHHRVEPVLDPAGQIRGALVAELRSSGVRPGVARALM